MSTRIVLEGGTALLECQEDIGKVSDLIGMVQTDSGFNGMVPLTHPDGSPQLLRESKIIAMEGSQPRP